MALALKHQTPAQFAARFWRRVIEEYQSGNTARYEYMIWWIWRKVQDGDITINDARLAFNAAYGRSLNLSQWNNLITTRLVPIKDRYLARISEASL